LHVKSLTDKLKQTLHTS